MFDSQKIDAFFDGDKPFENTTSDDKSSSSKLLRFMKLGFPCIAAILLGLMVIVPNIRKSVDLQDVTTMPRKEELEKLHMDDMIFYMTDSNNRVGQLTAENVDETAPVSQKVKIINPQGYIPTNRDKIDISSRTGFFNQKENILELLDNVQAIVDGDTVIATESATYEFNKDFGFGHEPVKAKGSWGTLTAQAFTYDKNLELLTLIGHNQIVSSSGTLTAEEKTEIYQNQNKVFAYGKAEVHQDKAVLHADTIIGWFSADDKHELQKAEAYGNVSIKTETETAYGAKGVYETKTGKVELFGDSETEKSFGGTVEVRQKNNVMYAKKIEAYLSVGEKKEIQKAVAYGGVRIKTPKGSAKGDRGVYNPQKNIVELFDNVIIEQDGNFIKGSQAETDLNTSVSRIRSDKKLGGRISGSFYRKKGK